jgi:hypothetical protein
MIQISRCYALVLSRRVSRRMWWVSYFDGCALAAGSILRFRRKCDLQTLSKQANAKNVRATEE